LSDIYPKGDTLEDSFTLFVERFYMETLYDVVIPLYNIFKKVRIFEWYIFIHRCFIFLEVKPVSFFQLTNEAIVLETVKKVCVLLHFVVIANFHIKIPSLHRLVSPYTTILNITIPWGLECIFVVMQLFGTHSASMYSLDAVKGQIWKISKFPSTKSFKMPQILIFTHIHIPFHNITFS
jgi:hypothetical protein